METYPYETVREFYSLNTTTSENGYYPELLEFCMIYPNSNGKTYWKRYLSFSEEDEFRDFIQTDEPLRIEVGGFGCIPACFWRGQVLSARRFEEGRRYVTSSPLAIDVDVKDYNDIRTCQCKHNKQQTCSDCGSSEITNGVSCSCEWKNLGQICRNCWAFVTSAMLVLEHILRSFWNFSDYYFFFSGKKGIHCWILDPETEDFTEEERSNFALSFDPWEDSTRKKLADEVADRNSGFAADFDSLIETIFVNLIIGDGTLFFFPNPETWNSILDAFDMESMDVSIFDRFTEKFIPTHKIDSCTLWEKIKDFLNSNYDSHAAAVVKRRLTYRYCFPRIDVEVTTRLIHAKKSIFSVHYETNRVSVPLLPHRLETILEFDPGKTPFPQDILTIRDASEALQRDLAVSDYLLKELSYCPARLGVPPSLNDAEIVQRLTAAEVFQLVFPWLVTNSAADAVIEPYEESHQVHYSSCKTCCDYVYIDSQFSLQRWINDIAWTGGVFSKDLEFGLKLTWLIYLRDHCKTIFIKPKTLATLTYYTDLLKLNIPM